MTFNSKTDKLLEITSKLFFKDTVCTADPVQVKLGDVNGQFQFNVFSFNENDNLLEVVCEFELCLSSENCFAPKDNECDQHYSKQEVSTTSIVKGVVDKK